MSKKPALDSVELAKPSTTRLLLKSGRALKIQSDGTEEVLEVTENDGSLGVSITFTPEGPLVLLEGAHLNLKAPESISLEANRIEIKSKEVTALKGDGNLTIDSGKEMSLRSDDNIRVDGKMIYLN